MASSQTTTSIPQVHHVDGPMLSHLNHFPSKVKNTNVPRATTSLVPILTPPLISSSIHPNVGGRDDDDADNNNDKHQYLLVPNPQRIIVRSAIHGKRICHLTPPSSSCSSTSDDNSNSATTFRAVTLVWLPVTSNKAPEEDDNNEEDSATNSDDEQHENNDDGEWVILAGCSDGYVYEWSITKLLSATTTTREDEGSLVPPRRSFQLTCSTTLKDLDLIHLTSTTTDEATSKYLSSSINGGGAVLYGLIKGMKEDDATATVTELLVRCEISPYNTKDDEHNVISLPLKPLAHVKTKSTKSSKKANDKNEESQIDHIRLKKKDEIFGLMAAYRPSSLSSKNDNDRLEYMMDTNNDDNMIAAKGEVFVVLCASHGLFIYRDFILNTPLPPRSKVNNNDSSSTNLVQFTKLIKISQQYYSNDQTSFSSMATSPNTKDLALGRANGHIEILDNVFENVANYLNRLGSATEANDEGSNHPDVVTVRRTMHWHAHPVRALEFLTAYSHRNRGGGTNSNTPSSEATTTTSFANPMSLISGGEESVLVTWQLDRNYHKPSNFVARVGQGGIVHTVYCQYTSRVIVFCADNSIQCYNGSNYEREWVEQGLASMALHPDDEEEDGRAKKDNDDDDDDVRRPKRGPIIMLNDPITNYPMITNLPGSPGNIHWYDTKSASVAGTLEVAPYNRVSRRDPTTDPHIPAPTVTHLAVGQDGKDMVTVDMVWTENTSVGASYDLVGPQGDIIPMNVYTSIKFWTYNDVDVNSGTKPADQRKRRNGDMPMNYELVSSMTAPHGRDGEVCSLAVAPNGRVACTLSQEEDAFRVWAKRTDSIIGSTIWKCLYRVKTPSGFANQLCKKALNSSTLLGGRQLVTFSSDGTVLSVVYGPAVTLWDYSNATLLTSVSLDDTDADNEDIHTVNFLTRNDDVMLLTSGTQIGVKSPFGGFKACYLGNDEWSFNTGSFLGKVSDVVPLYDFEGKKGVAGGHFALAITLNGGSKSIISIISRDDGSVVYAEGTPIQWQVDGEVQSLCVEKIAGSFVQLLAVTKDCQLLSLTCGMEEGRPASSAKVLSTKDARAQAQVLKIGADATEHTQEPSVKKRKISIGASRLGVAGFEFPALSGKFTSSFIAQSLGKHSA